MKSEVGEIFLFEIALFKFLDYKNLVKISEIKTEILSFIEKNQFKPQILKEYAKEVKRPPIEEKSIPKQENSPKEKLNTDIEKVFFELLNSNPLIKPMKDGISFIELKDDTFFITFNKSHAFEYFTKNRGVFEKKLSEIIGKEISLSLSLKDKKVEELNFEFSKMHKEVKEEKKENSLKDFIIDNFDGKVEGG